MPPSSTIVTPLPTFKSGCRAWPTARSWWRKRSSLRMCAGAFNHGAAPSRRRIDVRACGRSTRRRRRAPSAVADAPKSPPDHDEGRRPVDQVLQSRGPGGESTLAARSATSRAAQKAAGDGDGRTGARNATVGGAAARCALHHGEPDGGLDGGDADAPRWRGSRCAARGAGELMAPQALLAAPVKMDDATTKVPGSARARESCAARGAAGARGPGGRRGLGGGDRGRAGSSASAGAAPASSVRRWSAARRRRRRRRRPRLKVGGVSAGGARREPTVERDEQHARRRSRPVHHEVRALPPHPRVVRPLHIAAIHAEEPCTC